MLKVTHHEPTIVAKVGRFTATRNQHGVITVSRQPDPPSIAYLTPGGVFQSSADLPAQIHLGKASELDDLVTACRELAAALYGEDCQ